MRISGTLCLALAVATHAGAQQGSGQLAGRSVLAIQNCGRDRAAFVATVVAEAGGAWSAQDSEGRHFAGTWAPKGASGRKLNLSFDPDTQAAFVAVLVSDIAGLCHAVGPITVTSVVKKAFTLTVNRKRTKATLVLRYNVRGSAEGRSGTAHYGVKATGPWTSTAAPAP